MTTDPITLAARDVAASFERRVTFIPGYDRRSEGYGICAMRIVFRLIGEHGAAQWMIGTPWVPETCPVHPERNPRRPMGWDLGYHATKPQYEGQSPGKCDLLPGGECYCDGSGLNADLLIEGFITGGDEYVWRALEAFYASTFLGAEWPDFAAKAILEGDTP